MRNSTIHSRVRGLPRLAMATAALLALASLSTPLRAADAEPKLPEPEEVSTTTSDGVTLVATYYASDLGKKAVPLIIVHGLKGKGADFNSLALYLQKEKHCAVIVPDMRGHGKSTKVANGRDLDAATLKPVDLTKMWDYDLEAVKNFLLKKNNEGTLNIEKLGVIGSEFGATVALKWAARDWSWPSLIGVKQGRDVKALVLISPDMAYKGITAKEVLANKDLQSHLSIMLLVGDQGAEKKAEAKKINDLLERLHPEPSDEDRVAKKDYYFQPLPTSLQGAKLVGAKIPITKPGPPKVVEQVGIETLIGEFIERRLIKQPYPWTDRTSKL